VRVDAAILVLALGMGSCSCSGGPSVETGAAVAFFELPGGDGSPSGFYALPYPNDIHLSEAGIDLLHHPRPNALLEEYINAMSTRMNGFGLSPVVFFRFNQSLNEETLPPDAAASLAETSSVYLVDVDASSPERGRRFPIRMRFDALDGSVIGPNWMAAQLYPGLVLQEGNTYAVIVTNRLQSSTGQLSRDIDFEALIGEASNAPEFAKAALAYAPLLSYLDQAGGDERSDVVSAAVFTTQSVSGLLRSVREVIHRDVATPLPRDISV
jgi:hypothetical protein